jgi:hypothetical protein
VDYSYYANADIIEHLSLETIKNEMPDSDSEAPRLARLVLPLDVVRLHPSCC